MPLLRWGAAAPLLAVLLSNSAVSQAPPKPLLLVVHQPVEKGRKAEDVDMGFVLAEAIRASGKFDCKVFSPSLEEIAKAVIEGKLDRKQLEPPYAPSALQALGSAAGAAGVIRVTAGFGKEGLGVEFLHEARMGNGWATVLTSAIAPVDLRKKGVSRLDAIRLQAASIAERVTGRTTPPLEIARPGNTPPPAGSLPRENIGAPQPNKAPGEAAPAPKPAPKEVAPPAPALRQEDPPSSNEILVDRFRRQGDAANLIVALRRAVNDRPRDAKLRSELVRAYQSRGFHEEALAEAKRALDLMPEEAALHRAVGECLKAEGSPEAIAYFQAAVRLGPQDPANHAGLGDTLWNAGQFAQAEQCYRDAAAADPKSSLPLRKLARLLAARERFKQAVEAARSAMALLTDETAPAFLDDFASILASAEATLLDSVNRLEAIRNRFVSGAINREDAFQEVSVQKRRSQDAAEFFADFPGLGPLEGPQALFAQAAGLTFQAAESALKYLETQNKPDDTESTLLRKEALKTVAEARVKLKAATARRAN